MKKKAPVLHQVNHAVLQAVSPEHITVEMCRSEVLEYLITGYDGLGRSRYQRFSADAPPILWY
jgi:hypothetical protein